RVEVVLAHFGPPRRQTWVRDAAFVTSGGLRTGHDDVHVPAVRAFAAQEARVLLGERGMTVADEPGSDLVVGQDDGVLRRDPSRLLTDADERVPDRIVLRL